MKKVVASLITFLIASLISLQALAASVETGSITRFFAYNGVAHFEIKGDQGHFYKRVNLNEPVFLDEGLTIQTARGIQYTIQTQGSISIAMRCVSGNCAQDPIDLEDSTQEHFENQKLARDVERIIPEVARLNARSIEESNATQNDHQNISVEKESTEQLKKVLQSFFEFSGVEFQRDADLNQDRISSNLPQLGERQDAKSNVPQRAPAIDPAVSEIAVGLGAH